MNDKKNLKNNFIFNWVLKNKLAIEALDIIQKNKIYSIAVVDSKKVPVGIIRMHDLVEAGLV